MYPTLGQIGPFTLRTFTVLIDLGLVVALALLYLRAPAGKAARWLDAGLAAAIGGFAGARLLYIVVNGDFYFAHLDEVFQIWQGGLAWPGAPAGALLAAWVYCRRKREALAPLLDVLALPIALLGFLAWGGCAAAGCAYGFEVTPGAWPAWLTSHVPDLYGLRLPRFPTQVLGMLWSLLALAAVWAARRQRWGTGALGAYALSQVALGAFLLAFTRADPVPFISGFRSDVVGSALVLVAATAAWAWRLRPGQSPASAQPAPNPAQPPPADSVTADPLAHP